MAIQFIAALRNALGDAITAQVGGTAQIRIYSGSAPADCATAASGTLLAQLTGNATFAAAASAGVLTLNAITSATAAATGTAGYFRIYDSAGTTCKAQGTVGTSGADLNLNTVSIVTGATVAISSFTLTMPGA